MQAAEVQVPKVQLVSRQGCHLCDQVHAALLSLQERVPFELQMLDVDAQQELRWLYGWSVPVVLVGGDVVSRIRLDEEALLRRLQRDADGGLRGVK